MAQALGMLAGFTLGILLLAAIGRGAALRFRLPWREALTYFGVLAYPDEMAARRRAPGRPRRH